MSDQVIQLSTTRRNKSNPGIKSSPDLTLDKVVEMGEYDINFLSTFSQWQSFSKNMKWHYILQGLKNRRKFLELNYAETFNIIDFSKKPQLQQVLDNIQTQLKQLQSDEEKLRLEYT